MSILAQLVIAIAIFVAGGAAGIKWQVGVVAARNLKATNDAALVKLRRDEKVDLAANGHEKFKAAAGVREVKVIKEVERVVQNTVYSNVCLDADGLRIIASDIAARYPASEPAPAVPATAEPGKDGWRKRAALEPGSDPPVQ